MSSLNANPAIRNRSHRGHRAYAKKAEIIVPSLEEYETKAPTASVQKALAAYVLFSDSTIKPATNAQQWYVTISRGRRGIRIFTPDKQQLRQNVTRSGHRPLAMEFATDFVPRGRLLLWDRLHGYLLRFGRRAADHICRLKTAQSHHHQPTQKHECKVTR